MCRAGKVEQGTGKLAVGHHDDVQAPVSPPWPWEPAHPQVLLLLTILLLAHQVICEEPLLPKAVKEAAEDTPVGPAIWVSDEHVDITTGCLSPSV